MKKYLTRKNVIALFLTLLWVVPMMVGAQSGTFGELVGGSAGLGTRDIKETVAGIIQVVLGFLGLIALVIILLGGFKWMTAAGNEDKVAEAKKVLGAGIVGLIIIFAAYAIATFVINQIYQATNDAP